MIANLVAVLAGVHPALPWGVMTLATWFAVYAVRRWAPGAWVVFAAWGPPDGTAGQVFQALPSALVGALLGALINGGDPGSAIKGALAGALAPLLHHAMKSYSGDVGRP